MKRIDEMTLEELSEEYADLGASLSDAIALGDQRDTERLQNARLKVASRLGQFTPSGSGRALDHAAQERGMR